MDKDQGSSIILAGLRSGSRRALAQAITLVESRHPDHRLEALELMESLPQSGPSSIRLAISGPPGAGKSTLIEALGMHLLKAGHRVAVLAIDPSSPLAGGSILADRVRMEELSKQEKAFIRPSPSGGTLGGTARRTREAIRLCEAAGFNIVILETVGVGQSEIVAASMVDSFLLLTLPFAGDELQAMKRGIVEMADFIAVTKADGATLKAAQLAAEQIGQTLGGHNERDRVFILSALEKKGIDTLWAAISSSVKASKANGALLRKRRHQDVQWFRQELIEAVSEKLRARPDLVKIIGTYEQEVEGNAAVASAMAERAADAVLIGPMRH